MDNKHNTHITMATHITLLMVLTISVAVGGVVVSSRQQSNSVDNMIC